MKRIITFCFLTFITISFSFAQDQEPGFFPPEGCTFNADSSEVTLPLATVGEPYSETISFFASDEIELSVVTLTFSSATINNVDAPEGMSYSCNSSNCVFSPNQTGEVSLSGVPVQTGTYALNLTASIVVSYPPFVNNQEISIPYGGEIPLVNLALQNDYSAINEFVPDFFIEVVESDMSIVEDIKNGSINDLIVSPNPANSVVNFSFSNPSGNQASIVVFDLLGNLMHQEQIVKNTSSKQKIALETSSFDNGIYIYQLNFGAFKSTGRFVVHH